MTCRACVQLPLYLDGIDAIIDTQMIKPLQMILVHLAALENGRKPYIDTPKKYRGDIFLELCTESFKENSYVMSMNYYFKLVKTSLNDNNHITEK